MKSNNWSGRRYIPPLLSRSSVPGIRKREEEEGGGLERYITREDFEQMFPHRNEGGNAEYKLYEYEHLLSAAREYPQFANQGSEQTRRREVITFTTLFLLA